MDNNYVGNYVLLEEIDCGSFGCVYLVRHRFLTNRFAAMKLLDSTRLRFGPDRNRFLREAEFLSVLNHPFILSIYDAGIDEVTNIPYIVTEYAPGGSLRSLLRQHPHRPLAIGNAIAILTQVGEALHYAHQQNILHHDIKPENILFNAEGEALLADFGIAMMLQSEVGTRPTASIGTPAYMAPEQFRGYASRRSDQYSLACVAYELVTGRPPFSANNHVEMGLKHLQQRPVPPSRLNPHVPVYVEQAILTAMEKRRINRFADVLQFIEALQGIAPDQSPEPSISRPILLRGGKTKAQWLQDNAIVRYLKRFLATWL